MALENQAPAPLEDALFDNAIEGKETTLPDPAASPEPKPAVEQGKQPVEPTPQDPAALKSDPAADRQPVDDNAPLVPTWRLREITDEKRAALAERDALKAERDRLALERQHYQRQLEALQQPQQPAEAPEAPDPLLDPKGYREFMEKRFEERLVAERREASLQMARRVYREEFDQAYSAAQQLVDPALRFHMQRSADPGETLIAWFRDLKMRAEVGNDPAAYRKRVMDEALKDAEFRKRAMEAWREDAPAVGADGRPNVQLAPSLNGVSRSNAALRSASMGDVPDDALFDTVTTGPRPRR